MSQSVYKQCRKHSHLKMSLYDAVITLMSLKIVNARQCYFEQVSFPSGNYSRLSCDFYFVRSLGYYVIQIYVPSCLIVVLSWVSFWLSREAVPARVALGITTVLTMTTLISSTNASLPKISYLKSIDVYLVTCFVMVFISLLEFAAVSYMTNRSARWKKMKQKENDIAVEKMAKPTPMDSPIFGCRKGFQCDVTDPLTTVKKKKNWFSPERGSVSVIRDRK